MAAQQSDNQNQVEWSLLTKLDLNVEVRTVQEITVEPQKGNQVGRLKLIFGSSGSQICGG